MLHISLAVVAACGDDVQTKEADSVHGDSIEIVAFHSCHVLSCDISLHESVGKKGKYLFAAR